MSHVNLHISVRDDEVIMRCGAQTYREPGLDELTLGELDRLSNEANPTGYGRKLFDSLFVGELLKGYGATLEPQDTRCRIHLDLNTETELLQRVSWEAMTAKGPPPRCLGHSYRTPFSRHLPDLSPMEQTDNPPTDTLKVLLVVANPVDLDSLDQQLPPIDWKREVHAVSESLQGLRDRIDLVILDDPACVEAIRERLITDDVHILHVISHAARSDDGHFLALENEDRTAAPVQLNGITDLLTDLPSLRLVVLSGGVASSDPDGLDASAAAPQPEVFVGLAPRIIECGVPAVVAMQDLLEEDVARMFVTHFYGALVRSNLGMLDQAVNRARQTIFSRQRERWDWTVPVLFMAGDGVLFQAPQSAGDGRATRPLARPFQPPATEDPNRKRGDSDLRGGKRPEHPGKHQQELMKELPREALHELPSKEALFDSLVEHDVTVDELDTMYWALEIKLDSPQPATFEARLRELIDTAFAMDAVGRLQKRIRMLPKLRQRPGTQANLYDLGAHRAAREMTP